MSIISDIITLYGRIKNAEAHRIYERNRIFEAEIMYIFDNMKIVHEDFLTGLAEISYELQSIEESNVHELIHVFKKIRLQYQATRDLVFSQAQITILRPGPTRAFRHNNKERFLKECIQYFYFLDHFNTLEHIPGVERRIHSFYVIQIGMSCLKDRITKLRSSQNRSDIDEKIQKLIDDNRGEIIGHINFALIRYRESWQCITELYSQLRHEIIDL